MIFGHNHDNDFNTTYYGMEMIYGIKTGYGGYGPINERGGKILDIQLE